MRISFPWLALGLGLLIALVLITTGAVGPEADRRLPLLTLLIVTEFGFFLTAIGAGLALRSLKRHSFSVSVIISALGCGMLTAGFLWLGLELWPGGFPGNA